MKMMQNASNTGPQHSDELQYRINMEELLTTMYTTLDFDIPPGTPVADIVQAINLEFPGRDAEVVDQAAVLLHKKGTPPHSERQAEVRAQQIARGQAQEFWSAVKLLNNPPEGSQRLSSPHFPDGLFARGGGDSNPATREQGHSTLNTSAADTRNDAQGFLDQLPDEEAEALRQAMAEALEEGAGAKSRKAKAPGIFSNLPQSGRSVLPAGVWQENDGSYWRQGREYPIRVTLSELIAMWHAQRIKLIKLDLPSQRAA